MTAHIDEEEVEEDDLDIPVTQYGKRCKINHLKTRLFFTGLTLTLSLFCNFILIVRFML